MFCHCLARHWSGSDFIVHRPHRSPDPHLSITDRLPTIQHHAFFFLFSSFHSPTVSRSRLGGFACFCSPMHSLPCQCMSLAHSKQGGQVDRLRKRKNQKPKKLGRNSFLVVRFRGRSTCRPCFHITHESMTYIDKVFLSLSA